MLMKEINNISRAQIAYRHDRMSASAAEDITPANHSLVLAICRAPGRSQEEIARDLCLNKSTITRSLFQLEQRGYITREADSQDKRILRVMPTDKLLAVFPQVHMVSLEWNKLILDGISDEEKRVFCEVLLKIEANAKGIVNETARKRK